MNVQTLIRIASNPSYLAAIVDFETVRFVVKLVILGIALLYLGFCGIIFIQTRRLEKWLHNLPRYRFSLLMLIQLGAIVVGAVMVLLLL